MNQQVEPLLSWSLTNCGSNFALVGTEDEALKILSLQTKKWIEKSGGRVLYENYIPLGTSHFKSSLKMIKKLYDYYQENIVILCSLIGKGAIKFCNECINIGIQCPIITTHVNEKEIHCLQQSSVDNLYVASPYHKCLLNPVNSLFLQHFEEKYGDEPVCREAALAYDAVTMISLAYKKILNLPKKDQNSDSLRIALKNISW